MKQLLLLTTTFLCMLAGPGAMAQGFTNGDFESWTNKTTYEPDSNWITSNQFSKMLHDTLTVWKVPGFSGQAIHLQTAIIDVDTIPAFISNANNGVPYTQQPAAITGYFRYNLPGNDSAILIVEFKNAGTIIATNIFHIRGTGSLSAFTPFSFPLAAMSMAPDSVSIGAASSNITGTGLQTGSWLELDQLEFTGPGITQIIKGGSFDSWLPTTAELPDGWISGNTGGDNGITKSTTHYSGSYSIKMVTQPNPPYTSPAFIYNNMNGLPYTHIDDALTGYYMYSATGGDSAAISAYLKGGGTYIGFHSLYLHPAATWTYFEMPLSAMAVPDSMMITIASGNGGMGATSTLYLDHLQLKSQTTAAPGITIAAANKAIAYPNPARSEVNISIPHPARGTTTITIYDITQKAIGQWSYDHQPNVATIPTGYLGNGIYFYEVHTQENTYTGKFVKE